jgi:hypothetical protein
MKRMVFRLLPNVHLCVSGTDDPTDDEWTGYIDAVRAKMKTGAALPRMRTLVFTDGGGPNAAQRKLMNAMLDGRSTPVALVSSSVAVRSVTVALAWFNKQIRSFTPDQVTEAFAFLGVPPDEHAAIWVVVHALRRELGVANLRSIREGADKAPGRSA